MPRRALLRLIRDLLLAASAFVAGSLAFRAFVPPAGGLGLRNKMHAFEAHADEYDLVFIGASRTMRGIDPALFDAALAEEGIEIRSFNFGAGGMHTFEQDFLLDHVLERRPERLRWILFEGGPVGMTLADDHVYGDLPNLYSARGVQWHTATETWRILRALGPLPLPLGRKLEIAATHVGIFLRNATSFSKGRDVAEDLFETTAERGARLARVDEVYERQGHQGLEERTGLPYGREKALLLEDPSGFRAEMARIPVQSRTPIRRDELRVDVHVEQLERARAAGVELVHMTLPGVLGSPEPLQLFEAGVLPTLLHMNHPERFPELFELEYRYDKGHMNRRGVERLTHLLALEFARQLRSEHGE